jgi:hypothetical protein
MKRRLLLACALLVCVSPSLAAADSTSYDGRYNASMSCDATPSQPALQNEPFLVNFKDGQAQFTRTIYRVNTVTPSGTNAQGKGTVSPDGDMSLTETASGPGTEFVATYEGQFDGKMAHLSGAQQWHYPGTGANYSRPCTVTLSGSSK